MNKKLFCAQIEDLRQLNVNALQRCDMLVYKPADYRDAGTFDASAVKNGRNIKVYLSLPVFADSKDIEILERLILKGGFDGVLANNVYGVSLGRRLNIEVMAGGGLNIINKTAAEGYENILLSYEMYEAEYRLLDNWQSVNYFLYVYGRLPLMTLCHCPYQVSLNIGCQSAAAAKKSGGKSAEDALCGGVLKYRDDKGNITDIRRYRVSKCYFELLNSVPHNLIKYKTKLKPHFFFDFCGCGKKETEEILTAFSLENTETGNGKPFLPPEGKFTAGGFFNPIK